MSHSIFRSLTISTALTLGLCQSAAAQEAVMIVQHQVADFAEWKSIFDEAFATRESVGETAFKILQNPEDENSVTVVFQWDTLERAKAFAEDPVLENGMRAAGVISVPNFTFCKIANY
jgi:heme-degrading monooxygenase HmoA